MPLWPQSAPRKQGSHAQSPLTLFRKPGAHFWQPPSSPSKPAGHTQPPPSSGTFGGGQMHSLADVLPTPSVTACARTALHGLHADSPARSSGLLEPV